MVFKVSLIILLLLIANAFAQAQGEATCTLTPQQLAQAAELKGLWPGMTAEQVKLVVPSIVLGRKDALGLSKTSFSPDFNPKINKASWAGIRTVSLDFLDERLFSIWIGYNEAYRLKSADEVVKAITQSLKLTGAWEAKGRGQQLTCGDFQLVVTVVAGSPALRITDESVRATWEKRRTDKEEQNP